MNIYFFIQDITLTGGTERVTVNLSNLFIQKGLNVNIVSYYRGKDEVTYTINPKVNITFLSNEKYPINDGYIARLKSFKHSIRRLKYFFKSHFNQVKGEKIIISQNFFSNTLIWLSGKAKYAIGCEHFKYNLYPSYVRIIRCFIYSQFKKIVLLTDKDRDSFAKHLGKEKVFTIPNMVTTNEDIKLDINSKSIIAVGRLHPQKGFDLLIEAMKSVILKHPDWSLNIFGEGELKNELIEQIKKEKLSNYIKLKGYSNNIKAEFEKSAFFVLSSRYEGFPMVLVEALGLGVPSVAFDCPEGPSQLLANGGGILVDKENPSKLADAINYMIEHPEYRIDCSKNKDYIRKYLSPEAIYNKWIHLFQT